MYCTATLTLHDSSAIALKQCASNAPVSTQARGAYGLSNQSTEIAFRGLTFRTMHCQAERKVVTVANQAVTNLHSAQQKRAIWNPVRLSIYCKPRQHLLFVCLERTTFPYKFVQALPVLCISQRHPETHYQFRRHVKARYL